MVAAQQHTQTSLQLHLERKDLMQQSASRHILLHHGQNARSYSMAVSLPVAPSGAGAIAPPVINVRRWGFLVLELRQLMSNCQAGWAPLWES